MHPFVNHRLVAIFTLVFPPLCFMKILFYFIMSLITDALILLTCLKDLDRWRLDKMWIDGSYVKYRLLLGWAEQKTLERWNIITCLRTLLKMILEMKAGLAESTTMQLWRCRITYLPSISSKPIWYLWVLGPLCRDQNGWQGALDYSMHTLLSADEK